MDKFEEAACHELRNKKRKTNWKTLAFELNRNRLYLEVRDARNSCGVELSKRQARDLYALLSSNEEWTK